MELRDDPLPRRYVQIATAILATGLLVVSTVVAWSATEAMRVPKEIAFRAEAILLLVIAVFAATAGRGVGAGMRRIEWMLPLAIVAWTVITTLTSTNRAISEETLVTVIAGAIIFLVTRRVMPQLPLLALDVCLAIASVNAVVVMLQEWGGWNPFQFPPEVTGHTRSVGLLGHPNDVGTYLAGPAIAAVVGVVAVRGWRRLAYAGWSIVLLLGVVASGTRTAIFAVPVGIVVLALIRPPRQAVITLILLVVALFVIFRPSTSVGQRVRQLVAAAKARQYDVLFSERLPPYLSAIDMARAKPLTGVGPGCFGYHFMETRMSLATHYPEAWTRGWPMNFAEAHNDHLQVMAETGLIGYALFFASMLIVAIRSPRLKPGATDRGIEQHYARALAAPLMATFFVLCLAQFPLELAAPRAMYLTLAALVLGWQVPRD